MLLCWLNHQQTAVGINMKVSGFMVKGQTDVCSLVIMTYRLSCYVPCVHLSCRLSCCKLSIASYRYRPGLCFDLGVTRGKKFGFLASFTHLCKERQMLKMLTCLCWEREDVVQRCWLLLTSDSRKKCGNSEHLGQHLKTSYFGNEVLEKGMSVARRNHLIKVADWWTLCASTGNSLLGSVSVWWLLKYD